ncbi:hypothetical protein LAZ67_11003776 [Cordylochernes scorpioides]|uniref:Major facilitator superfamily (MFS) profile domain-containing protein n=1 Tax=Cordylochernes scorpioides TaxID=51811 RepID=A0ABY6L0X0_9ARAC|nr:hypothetical protein LAZ67_11003776 [Cordylochernes scorpioides]
MEPLLGRRRRTGCFPYIPARWVMTILGFLGFFNVYALRVNLSVAMVAMVNHTAIAGDSPHSNDCPVIGPSSNSSSLVFYVEISACYVMVQNGPFIWGPSTQSWILSSFFIGYIMTQVPGGRLSEMIGPKWLYGGGILTTAVFSLVTPLAAIYGDVWGVVAVRILIGLGEGVTYPAMHVLIARWIPQFERSFKATLIYLGAPIGTVVSSILSGQISGSHDLGWPYVFYIFGLISILWFVLWAILIYGTPEDHPRISLSELDFIKNNTEPPTEKAPKAPWMKLLKSGPLWGLIIAHLGQNCGFYMLLTELPTYMGTILHYDIKQVCSSLDTILCSILIPMVILLIDYLLVLNILPSISSSSSFLSQQFGIGRLVANVTCVFLQNGLLSSLPYLLQAIVGLVVGRGMDWALKREYISVTKVRKICNSIAITVVSNGRHTPLYILSRCHCVERLKMSRMCPGFLGPAICLIAVCQAGCLAKLSTAFFCLALAFNGFIYSGYQVVHIDMDPSLAGRYIAVVGLV